MNNSSSAHTQKPVERHQPPRILFLRSQRKICSFSLIANGLCNARNIEFLQYPPFPPESRSLLQKLSYRDIAWDNFNTNLLPDRDELCEKLRSGYFNLVLLADHDVSLFASHQRGWRKRVKTLAELARGRRSLAFPLSLRELCQLVPVIVVDLTDPPYIRPADVAMLEHCQSYFKREIPYNRFVLYHALLQFDSFSRARKDERLQALLPKVQSIPLGIPDDKFHTLTPFRTTTQDIDVFWAGSLSNTMRATAIRFLEEFTARTSRNVVIAQQPLSFQEYCETVARSKVTVSVEGGGWDCDRHYEAVALGSVPLMNTPTVDAAWWHSMPEEVFFDNSFSNFTARLEHLLLNDKVRQKCFQELDRRIREQMLWSKIIEYMIARCSRLPIE